MVTVAAVTAVLGKNTVCEGAAAAAPFRPEELNVDSAWQGDVHLHSPLVTKMVHLDAFLTPAFLTKAASVTASLCTVR